MRPTLSAATLPRARADLLHHLFEGGPSAATLESDLVSWLDTSARFERFLSVHRDKVRKKLRTASDEDAVLDVRAELLVAALLVSDRRFEAAFEAYGAGKRGPDLTV